MGTGLEASRVKAGLISRRRAAIAVVVWLALCLLLAFEAVELEERLVYSERPFVPREAESFVGLELLRGLKAAPADYALVVFSPNDLSSCEGVEAAMSRVAAEHGAVVVGPASIYGMVLAEVRSRLAGVLSSAVSSVVNTAELARNLSATVEEASRVLNLAYSAALYYLEAFEKAREQGDPDPSSAALKALLAVTPPHLIPFIERFHERFVALSAELPPKEAAREALLSTARELRPELYDLLSSFDFSNYTDRRAVVSFVYERSGVAALGISLEEFATLIEDPLEGARRVAASRLSSQLDPCMARALEDALSGADPSEAVSAHCESFVRRLAPFPDAIPTEVRARLVSGRYAIALMTFDREVSAEEAQQVLSELRSSLKEAVPESYVTGSLATSAELARTAASEVRRVDRLTVVLVVTLLLLLTASLAAPLVVLAVTGAATLVALGALSILAERVDIYYMTRSAMIPLVFGITVDYSLFYLLRVAEERAGGLSWAEAVSVARTRAGRALVLGGVAVVLGFAAYYLTPEPVISSAGLALMVGSAAGFLSSYTLLPYVLLLLGERASLWPSRAVRPPGARAGAFLRRLSSRVVRTRATAVTAATLAVTAAVCALYVLTPVTANLYLAMPRGSDVVRAGEILAEAFPIEAYSTLYVLLPSQALVEEGLSRLLEVEHVKSVVARPMGNWTVVMVGLSVDPFDDRVFDVIPRLREAARSLDPRALVTGLPALRVDLIDSVLGSYWRITVPLVLALVFLYLVAGLGSVLVPASFLVPVILSTFAGLLASALLMLEPMREASPVYVRSTLYWFAPVATFALMVTVGTDYNVFLAARVRENAASGMRLEEAILSAVERVGSVIAACGVILAGAFSSLLFTETLLLRQVGLAVVASVALDTLIVMPVVMPAMLKVLGKRAWWPGRGLVAREALTE